MFTSMVNFSIILSTDTTSSRRVCNVKLLIKYIKDYNMSEHYQKTNYENFTKRTQTLFCKSWIIKCRTLCKIPEANWLKVGDVV